MVHQLLLVSSIPHSKYVQTISTLQAMTRLLSPQPISTYTLVTKPSYVFKPKFEPGKVNQIEQYYMKCTTTWESGVDLDLAIPLIADDETSSVFVERLFSGNEEVERTWTLQISDIPIAGKQVCSNQTIYESTLIHAHARIEDSEIKKPSDIADGDAMEIDDKVEEPNKEVKTDSNGASEESSTSIVKSHSSDVSNDPDLTGRKDSFLLLLESLGYGVVNQYWLKGVRFFQGDIVIEIFKIFIRDDNVSSTDANNNKIKLKLLDESNTFQIKAYINIPKSTDIEQISQGSKDLLKLQDLLKNLFKLEIPDRMFMDSRVTLKKAT
ncbi:mediator of RNA polymerase II transcription subunit 18 [Scheffersomyces coipomensis]|uniref:mediator of RNA polymerase II transcription subunit 18 n=1 Tax=Scheffersomyces coipomensis TaxID=1788519 RepID=UPI00315D5170